MLNPLSLEELRRKYGTNTAANIINAVLEELPVTTRQGIRKLMEELRDDLQAVVFN